MVQSMLICMCMHMWYSSRTHIFCHHMHFDQLKAKFSIHFQYWQESFKFTASLFFSSSSSSSSLHIAIDIMMFSLPFLCATHMTELYSKIKKQQTKEWTNEWMENKYSKNCLSRLLGGFKCTSLFILNKKNHTFILFGICWIIMWYKPLFYATYCVETREWVEYINCEQVAAALTRQTRFWPIHKWISTEKRFNIYFSNTE